MTLYFVQTAALAATPPRGGWHATVCQGNPAWPLCLVERWADDAADDEWETATQAQPVYPEHLGNVVPAVAVQALGAWGVVATDTMRQALRKVRSQWPIVV